MSLVSDKVGAYKQEIHRYGEMMPGVTEAYHALQERVSPMGRSMPRQSSLSLLVLRYR